MQTSSSTLLCFIASLLPSNPRESLAYSMGFHSARLHLPSALAPISQHNLYEAFLLEDNQARKKKTETSQPTAGLARIVSPCMTQLCCLPPAQCRKGEMATAPVPAGPGSRQKVAVQPSGPGLSHSPHMSLPLAGAARVALEGSC